MGIISRINDAVRGRSSRKQIAYQETNNSYRVNPLCDDYENVYAQVRPLINEMLMVTPYGIGRNGARLDAARTPELNVLNLPNDKMGWAEFADLMFATWLTEKELNIHVWRNRSGRVYGYTILPPDCRVPASASSTGEEYFEFVNSDNAIERLSRDEVMTLRYSRSPRDIDKGVSPAKAIQYWLMIDDLIAQYQKAVFENGAFPSTITYIKATTREDYEAKRHKLENGLKGARNRNKTIFIWRAFDNSTGESQDEIEVKPIQVTNSTLALKDLISIVNDKVNKAYGVSNFILGDDSSAKYDNAELSDRQFLKRVVRPALIKFWSEFQHGLDMITGGIGYAITFDLELPELTERLKVKAEISKTTAETLKGLIESGSKPSAAVEALGLSKKWLGVAAGIYNRVQDEGGPSLTLETKQKAPNIIPPQNSRKDGSSEVAPSSTKDVYTPSFSADEELEQKIYAELLKVIRKVIDPNFEMRLEEVEREINKVLIELANDGALKGATTISGLISGTEIGNEIKAVIDGDGFQLSADFDERLTARTNELVREFDRYAKEVAFETLNTARAEGLSAQEITARLQESMPRRRAELIARNETVHAFRAGRLENDNAIAERWGLKISKVWRTSGDNDVCALCAAMDGTKVEMDSPFPDRSVDADGHELVFEHTHWNEDGRVPNGHVNCRCYFDEVDVEVINA